MALDREQQRVLGRILAIGRRRGASPKELKAAVETGLVESGLRNLPGGDADSAGWRQERASLYPNPTDLDASVNRFFDETGRLRGKFGRAGDLAAAVQRPAAQYRGRYHGVSGEADRLLGRSGGAQSAPGPALRPTSAPEQSGGQQLAGLLALAPEQPRPSMGLQAPAFAAGPVLPAGAQAVVSSGAPKGPGSSLAEALSAVQGLSGAPGAAPEVPRAGSSLTGAPRSEGAAAAVDFARSRVGQYKESSGANRGPQLDRLQARLGFKGAPWCAIFTSVAVTRGGAPKVARTASVAEVRRQAQEGGGGYLKGFQKRARAGDLILFGNDHIGLVEGVDSDGSIRTIEGNTGSGEVARRRRAAGSGSIVRPRYAG